MTEMEANLPTYTVTVRVRWDMGHRLVGHEGHCRFLHGHSYEAEITCRGRALDDLGMVIDFGDVKSVARSVIRDWDHALWLSEEDPLVIELQRLHSKGTLDHLKLVTSRQNPTAEVIASTLYRALRARVSPLVLITNVRVQETPDSWAAFRP